MAWHTCLVTPTTSTTYNYHKMKKLTFVQFIDKLRALKGAAIVGITARTDAKARKTGNPFGTIFKTVRTVGFVGADYGAAVVREGARQGADAGAFEAASLPWGEWLENAVGKVITHKGGFYLRTQSTPGQRKRQAAKVLGYVSADGTVLERAEVEPFLPTPSVSRKQAAVGVGREAAEQIMVRTYAFDSIKRVRFAGETFQLVAG